MRSWIIASCLAAAFPSAQAAVHRSPIRLLAEERLIPEGAADAPIFFRLRQNGWGSLEEEGTWREIAKWQIQIFDSDGRKVAFLQGVGSPPARALPWSGLSSRGDPLPDGYYRARLVWVDVRQRSYASAATTISLLSAPDLRDLVVFR